MVDIKVVYQNIINELHNLSNLDTNIKLLDITDIDCNNLNENILKELVSDSELIQIKEKCNIPKNSLRSDILNFDINNSFDKNEESIDDTNPIIKNITSLLKDSESSIDISKEIEQVDDVDSEETGYENTSPEPIVQPEPTVKSISNPSIKPKIVRLIAGNNLNIIKPLQRLTSSTIYVKPQTGGDLNTNGLTISFNKINNILYKNCPTIHQITTYYYINESNKILNLHELILILVSFKYCEFLETKVNNINEIINSTFINNIHNIPEKFKFNFYDLISKDINNNDLIKTNIIQVSIIKKLINSLSSENKSNTDENLDNYNNKNLVIGIVGVIGISSQEGGASKKDSKYQLVDEKINEKIRRLSDYLKSKNKKHTQRGGGFNSDQQNKINEINTITTSLITSISTAKSKDDAKNTSNELINHSNI